MRSLPISIGINSVEKSGLGELNVLTSLVGGDRCPVGKKVRWRATFEIDVDMLAAAVYCPGTVNKL